LELNYTQCPKVNQKKPGEKLFGLIGNPLKQPGEYPDRLKPKPFPCFKSEIWVDSQDILTDFKMLISNVIR
jgi:hypothetical protein